MSETGVAVNTDIETVLDKRARDLVHTAVKRGYRVLNMRWPGWFENHFDVETFDIQTVEHCVTGQFWEHGGFGTMCSRVSVADAWTTYFGMHHYQMYVYGFDIPDPTLRERLGLRWIWTRMQWYDALHWEWVMEHHYRQAQWINTDREMR